MLYLDPCNDGEGHVIERLASKVYRSATCVPSLVKRVRKEGYLSPPAISTAVAPLPNGSVYHLDQDAIWICKLQAASS